MNKKEIIEGFAEVINRNNVEAESNTPDFVLAAYLYGCLESFNTAVVYRAAWYSGGDESTGNRIMESKPAEVQQ